MTETLDIQLSELRATRQSLALALAEGDLEAESKLREVEGEIGALLLKHERQAAADEERAERAKAEAEEEARRRSESQRRDLTKLARERMKVAGEIDAATDDLLILLARIVGLEGEMKGGHPALPSCEATVGRWLNGKLSTVLRNHFSYDDRTPGQSLQEIERRVCEEFISQIAPPEKTREARSE